MSNYKDRGGGVRGCPIPYYRFLKIFKEVNPSKGPRVSGHQFWFCLFVMSNYKDRGGWCERMPHSILSIFKIFKEVNPSRDPNVSGSGHQFWFCLVYNRLLQSREVQTGSIFSLTVGVPIQSWSTISCYLSPIVDSCSLYTVMFDWAACKHPAVRVGVSGIFF